MRPLTRTLALTILLLSGGGISGAYSQLTILGGNINMTVTTGVAGGEPIAVTNATISLRYRLQNRITKITVRTSCPGQRFSLAVVATSVPQGTAAPQVTLTNGMLAVDLIVSLPLRPPNTNQLGNDVHTITYPLLDQ